MLHFARLPLTFGFGFGLVGTIVLGALGIRAAAHRDMPIPAPAPAPAVADVPTLDQQVTYEDDARATAPEVPDLTAADFAFVVAINGTSYVKLTDETAAIDAAKGRARLVVDKTTYITSAIAPIAAPAAFRDWQGRTVTVDGTCTARVVGFATIAQVTGTPAYAGIDADDWTVASVTSSGSRMIAARLDGCATGTWARDAAKPAAGIGLALGHGEPERLVAAATADLYASEAATRTDASWNDPQWDAYGGEGNADGNAKLADWRTTAELASRVVEHPITHARWIVIHASVGGGCGERSVNLVGIYRADPAHPDRVIAVRIDESEVAGIEDLVDIDNDGRFELIVTDGFGPNRSLRDLDNATLSSATVPFHGCPC